MSKMGKIIRTLPIIRHARYFVGLYRVNRHYEMYAQLGMIPVYADHDMAVLDAIWRGEA